MVVDCISLEIGNDVDDGNVKCHDRWAYYEADQSKGLNSAEDGEERKKKREPPAAANEDRTNDIVD